MAVNRSIGGGLAAFGCAGGAALAAGIFAASVALPETRGPLLRRALVDVPAAALALAGGPHREWRMIMGETP